MGRLSLLSPKPVSTISLPAVVDSNSDEFKDGYMSKDHKAVVSQVFLRSSFTGDMGGKLG